MMQFTLTTVIDLKIVLKYKHDARMHKLNIVLDIVRKG